MPNLPRAFGCRAGFVQSPDFPFHPPQKIHITCFTKTLHIPLAKRISFLHASPQYISYGTCHILLLCVFVFYPPTLSHLHSFTLNEPLYYSPPCNTPHSTTYTQQSFHSHVSVYMCFGPSKFLDVRR